ncbi:MAG: heparin lyase I family protein [Neomegalonema sp.]|nr:heparin lyase I family protein [Neomegalonema sp.]
MFLHEWQRRLCGTALTTITIAAILAATASALSAKSITLDDGAYLMTTPDASFVDGADNVADQPEDTDLDGDLIEGGMRFNFDAKGDPGTIRIWKDGQVSFNGSHSLAYEVRDPGATGETCPGATNKLMHQIYGGLHRNPIYPVLVSQDPETNACGPRRAVKCTQEFQRFGERRFFSFSIFIPPEPYYIAPLLEAKRSIIYQLWQGSPFSPAIAGVLESGDEASVHLRFVIRNDATGGASACSAQGWNDPSIPLHAEPIKLQRNVWNRLTIMTLPHHMGESSQGQIKIWKVSQATLKNEPVVDWQGQFGFDPATARLRGRAPMPFFQVMIGIYRERQATRQRLYFDAIYEGERYIDVKPNLIDALQ